MDVDYTNLSKTYDSNRSFPEELHIKIVELGRIRQGTSVLDIGCGTGNAAAVLSKVQRACVTGMDKSPDMLEKARAKNVSVVRADADAAALPFRSFSFDAVLGIYVIHQIRDLAGLFSECRRILRKGALVLLTSSHDQIRHQHPTVEQFFPSFVAADLARFPELSVVDGLLEQAGFQSVRRVEVGIDKIPLDEKHLQKARDKYISTYELIPEDEFASGVRELEAYIRSLEEPEFREWRATLIVANARG